MLFEHRIRCFLLFPACYRNTLFTIQVNFSRMKWLWRTQIKMLWNTMCTKKEESFSFPQKTKGVCKINFIVLHQERNLLSSFSIYWTTDVDEQNFQDKTPAYTRYTTSLKSRLLCCIFLNITFSYCFSFGWNTWQRLSFKENNRWMPCLYLINIIRNTCKCRRHSGTGCAMQMQQMKIK